MSELPPTLPVILDYATPRRKKSTIVALIKWLLFVVVLGFVVYSLKKQFDQITWSEVHFKPLPVLGAFICLLLVPPVQLISYRTLLGAYAQTPSLRVMAVVAWIPPLGKYVPGKVASLVGAVYILRKFNIPAAIAVSVVLAMDGLAVISGLITGSPLPRSVMPNGWIPAIGVIVIGITCLHPSIFGRILNLALVKTGRRRLDHVPDLKHYVVPVLCAFCQWVLAGIALWLIALSVASVSVHEIPRFISIAGLGYTISYLVLFAPGGLGPREFIFQKMMQNVVSPVAMSAIAVVLMRIIQTITELTAAAVGVLILRRLERSLQGPPDSPSEPQTGSERA
jgi:glycosyltransferase 2 family protein